MKKRQSFILTKQHQQDIREMFFGGYKPEWKDKNGVVDNSDLTIAKRLEIPKSAVENYITLMLDIHFNKIIKYHNEII